MRVILFTDVEASTRLWEQHPVSMRSALARHDAFLQQAVRSANGDVVKTTGDGLMATFTSVGDCVASCLEAQRALRTADWETGQPLRVRMGINVGEVEERDGDFYGTAVNRAARIMSAGHGGQVLLSELAAAAVADFLPAGAQLRDLGAHRLKDLSQPEHLYQLLHPDLEADFPPLATLDAKPNNLPTQASRFFGRDTELAAARETLGQTGSRVLTLTGPGGTGKTRLALQLAAELADAYPDGVFFVDLSAAREQDAVFEAMLRDLELTGAREGAALQVLKARLVDKTVLVILDNFEQVTEAATGLADLIQHCPNLTVVVTSRETLRIRGEQVIPIPPLSVPDAHAPLADLAQSEAVRLFVDRARAVRPDFALTAENAAAVAEICIWLDGLPLALELAAARLRLFTASDLLGRLRTHADVLGSGARDLPARQRTLRGTIDWSFELLDEHERRLFQMLSVFSGVRLEAAEQVADIAFDDSETIEVLASLVDKSLVRSVEVAGSQRFSMLRTIQEYAAERLEESPGAAAAVRHAHARFYAQHAADLRPALHSHAREAVLADLVPEVDNLRTAWKHWVRAADLDQLRLLLDGLWALHDARGWYHGVIELTTDLLGVLAHTPPSLERDEEEMTTRTRLARALMTVRGYTVEVDQEFARVLELSGAATTAGKRIPVLRTLSSYYTNRSEFERAAELGREILEIAEIEREGSMLLEGHLVFGVNAAMGGDLDGGLGHLARAIELFDPELHGAGRFHIGPSPGVIAPMASALVLRNAGWPEQSTAHAADALAMARRIDHPYSLAYALYHSGLLAVQRSLPDETLRYAEELHSVASVNDYSVWRALSSVLRGVALCGIGRADEGIALTEAGHDLYLGLTTPPVFWAPLLALRADAFAMAGRGEEALALVDQAIAVVGNNEAAFPRFWIQRGDIVRALPEPDMSEAQGCYRAAVGGARTASERLTELAALTRLVGLLMESGGTPDHREELAGVYATFTEGFAEPELIEAQAVLALADR